MNGSKKNFFIGVARGIRSLVRPIKGKIKRIQSGN